MKRILNLIIVLTMCLIASSTFSAEESVYISRAEVMGLPASGTAWNAVVSASGGTVLGLNLSDQDDPLNVRLFAKALVGVRNNNATLLAEVRGACMAVMETENGGRTLALGRELCAVVIAADLAQLSTIDNTTFCNWLRGVMRETLDGRTLISTHEDRPNNWGTHAGASRAAANVYLISHGSLSQRTEAQTDLARTARVFRGYLGDRSQYTSFNYGDLDWQATPSAPVGINLAGTTIQGHPVGGVLPDDQRRGGGFAWPPPKENYVWEALQGVTVQAEILHRQGFSVFSDSNSAIFRSLEWLHDQANFPATGDDKWSPWIVNFRYSGRNFPASSPASYGKNLGYTDWTHGPGRPTGNVSDPPPDPIPMPAGLVVSPTTITVTAKVGATPSPQLVNVTSDGSPINFTASSSEAWAVPSPTSGTTPQGVNVTFLSSALPIGTYTATETFTPTSGAVKTVVITLTITAVDPPPPPPPPPGPGNKIAVRVSANSDDAEERLRLAVSLSDGDTNLINPVENIAVGIRFTNLAIPRGATIVSAEIEFVANQANSDFCRLKIGAHFSGNSPTFIASSANISGRTLVSHGVFWEPVPWTTGTLHKTPNLSLVVADVTNRLDWNPGNAISFILRNETGTGKRIAKNFNSPANAAVLKVTYTVP